MYEITTRIKRVEKQYNDLINEKIKEKLEILKQNPRGKLGAHKSKKQSGTHTFTKKCVPFNEGKDVGL